MHGTIWDFIGAVVWGAWSALLWKSAFNDDFPVRDMGAAVFILTVTAGATAYCVGRLLGLEL